MKKLLLTLTAVTATALTTLGQGTVSFNNEGTFATQDAITISTLNMGAAGGLAGQGIGGDKYAVQLVWVAGTGLNQAQFNAGVQNFGAVTTGVGSGGNASSAFLANTGNLSTFAGFFDGGQVPSPTGTTMPVGGYTMQVLAWYKVGFATYAAAVAGGANNVGKSALFNVNVTTVPVQSTVFPGFQVGLIIPEPSSLALAGLGASAMLVIRRKK